MFRMALPPKVSVLAPVMLIMSKVVPEPSKSSEVPSESAKPPKVSVAKASPGAMCEVPLALTVPPMTPLPVRVTLSPSVTGPLPVALPAVLFTARVPAVTLVPPL